MQALVRRTVDELRDDLRLLRVLVDAALDEGADRHLLAALAELLKERQDELRVLERRRRHEVV
jgi:hypothetical protein